MKDLEPIEALLREGEHLDPNAHLVARGWPLTIDGLLRNAEATRSRFSLDGRSFSAISAEVTVAGWTLDSILSGPRLQTRSRYAAVSVGELVGAGFGLLPTFVAPHYGVLLDPYTPERAQHLLEGARRGPDQPPSREEAAMSEKDAVVVTLPADVQQIDQTGYVWAFLDTATSPERVQIGTLIVAGDVEEPFLARVIDIVDGPSSRSIVHLDVVGVPDQAIDELRHAHLLPQ